MDKYCTWEYLESTGHFYVECKDDDFDVEDDDRLIHCPYCQRVIILKNVFGCDLERKNK